MRAKLLLAAAAAPVLLFASCSSVTGSRNSTGTTTTSSPAASSSSGGAGGTTSLSGTGSFTVSGTGTGGSACGTSDAGADASTGCDGLEGGVTFGGDVNPIFVLSCNGELCHATPTYAAFVNQPASDCCDGELFVKPGDADHSYVMNKITGDAMCKPPRMPFGLPPLADADILTIRRWICEGAPDD